MTYNVRHVDSSKPTITVDEGTTNNQTDLNLFGYIKLEYGEYLNENILRLLENFASPEDTTVGTSLSRLKEPTPDLSEIEDDLLVNPIEGQIWHNKTQNRPYIFNGSEFNPIGVNGDYAANWGVIRHGEIIPRPVSTKSGYEFPYEECIWVVSPYNVNARYNYFICTTTPDARVTSQIRTLGNAILNSYANYLIIGIRGNRTTGVLPTPPAPSVSASMTPTPTPTLSIPLSSGASPTPSPTPSPSITPTPTPTPTPSDASVFRVEIYDGNIESGSYNDVITMLDAACSPSSYEIVTDEGYLDCAGTYSDCLIGSCAPKTNLPYSQYCTIKVFGGTAPYEVRVQNISGSYIIGSECIYFNDFMIDDLAYVGTLDSAIIAVDGGTLLNFPVLSAKCGNSQFYALGTIDIEIEDALGAILTETLDWTIYRDAI